MAASAEMSDICVKWKGSEYKIAGLTPSQSVKDLKDAICKVTGVLPERQKLMGIKYKGSKLGDEVILSELGLMPSTKIMMIGTREEELVQVIEPPADLTEVVNDFDVGDEEEVEISNRSEYLAKVEKRVQTYNFKILNPPRDGTKLLVLDVDYTLFDHRSAAETGKELMRPYLHEFLTSAYEKYDIVIWSATSMVWIEAKMQEIGVASNTNYRICFMMDSLAMITVDTPTYGVIDVKPLGVIWGRYPQWNKTNTIMFDDLRRNFIMNPQNGLKIRPFKNAHTNRSTDTELLGLAQYLQQIAELDDISVLNHNHWAKYGSHHRSSSSHKKHHKHHHHHHHHRSHDSDEPS